MIIGQRKTILQAIADVVNSDTSRLHFINVERNKSINFALGRIIQVTSISEF
jgi:hypothetical protein